MKTLCSLLQNWPSYTWPRAPILPRAERFIPIPVWLRTPDPDRVQPISCCTRGCGRVVPQLPVAMEGMKSRATGLELQMASLRHQHLPSAGQGENPTLPKLESHPLASALHQFPIFSPYQSGKEDQYSPQVKCCADDLELNSAMEPPAPPTSVPGGSHLRRTLMGSRNRGRAPRGSRAAPAAPTSIFYRHTGYA